VALIIEDGAAKADAQSYATVTELRGYATLRGATVPVADADCEALLVKAVDYLQSLDFVGDQFSKEQALKWPRANACVESWPLETDEIPRQLVQAQCALAIEAQTIDLLPTIPIGGQRGPVIAESVAGAVSRAYANNGTVRETPAIAKARALLTPLLKNRGLFVIRA
jgi:hypothetical protein